MNDQHLSEEQLQSLAMVPSNPDAGILAHQEACPLCQQQIVAYQQIIGAIKELPAPAFDFNLEAAVLEELQQPAYVENNYYRYIFALIIAGIVIATLYIFRQNFLNLSAGISSLFLAISIIACIGIIVFKVIKLYQQYNLQIKKLNFSE